MSNFTDNWYGVSIGMLGGSDDPVQTQRIKEINASLTAVGISNEEIRINGLDRQRMSPWFETNVLYLVIGHKPDAVEK